MSRYQALVAAKARLADALAEQEAADSRAVAAIIGGIRNPAAGRGAG